jgi:tRNA A-37 threonylcarbamoyl transferase component Bud32
MLRTGDRVGNYVIARSLGSGAMGTVFEAVHEQIRSRVAIKVLHPQYAEHPELRVRFFQEAYTANRVGHPGVVSVFDHGEAEGAAYIIMELLDGEPLHKRARRGGKLIDRASALRILRQVASVIAAAHERNIVHRDLKPENIMVLADPFTFGGERIKVLDFGIAKVLDEVRPTRTSIGLFGTPLFMAPEAWQGAQQTGPSVDIYALGVMAYELLVGKAPFVDCGDNIARWQEQHETVVPRPLLAIDPSIPKPLSQLCERMLKKDRSERPTAREAVHILEQLVSANLRFRAGGFVRDGEFYVRRAADEDALRALCSGRSVHIVGARQSGKTSLASRLIHRLRTLREPGREQGFACAQIDLLALVSSARSAEALCFELLRELHRGLGLFGFVGDLWQQHEGKAPAERLRLVLAALPVLAPQPSVVFLDHLEALLRAPLDAKDLNDLIRALRPGRVPASASALPPSGSASASTSGTAPVAASGSPSGPAAVAGSGPHLSVAPREVLFCTLSVLRLESLVPELPPSQLPPHLLIELADFTREEADALLPGLHSLGAASGLLLDAVLEWTAGHPYLTQRLCELLSGRPLPDGSLEVIVESAAAEVLAAHRRGEEPALAYAERQISGTDAAALAARRLLRQLVRGERIAAADNDEAQRTLRRAGLVRTDGGTVQLRNRIFAKAFDEAWLHEKDSVRPIRAPLERWLERGRDRRYLLNRSELAAILLWAQERTDLSAEEQRLIAESLQADRQAQARKIMALSGVLLVLICMLGVTAYSLRRAHKLNEEVQRKQLELQGALRLADVARNEAVRARDDSDAARRKTQVALDRLGEALRAQKAALAEVDKQTAAAATQRGLTAEARRHALEAEQRANQAMGDAVQANEQADRTARVARRILENAAQVEEQLRARLAATEGARIAVEQQLGELQRKHGELQQQYNGQQQQLVGLQQQLAGLQQQYNGLVQQHAALQRGQGAHARHPDAGEPGGASAPGSSGSPSPSDPPPAPSTPDPGRTL